ncbi:MAG: DUF4157 domain-containing protein [Pseudomonadota bacterium]|nr:DUF4157 domain-containing protein [Pseudomonadota bacterium]
MFASRNHNQAKEPVVRRPERGDSTPDRKTSSEQNPLWQSLAMRSGILQPKLTIGQTDDPYEREADRIADQVMRMSAPPSDGYGLSITPGASHRAQRKCAACEEEEDDSALQRKESGGADAQATAPAIVHESLSSPGQPLDAETRAYFEPRFGSDFSEVRVHTDSRAVESARAVNALAYTVGRDVVIRDEKVSPVSPASRRLLAHELTHVIQQGGAATTRGPVVSLANMGSTRPGVPRLYRTPDDRTTESESGYELEGSLSLSFQGGGSIVARYHTEQETPSAGIPFHWLALTQDVFNNPPLLPLLEEACGQWVRFDIGETSPDTRESMPDPVEGSTSEFGESNPEELGASPEQTLGSADGFGTVWMRINPAITIEAVADSLAFPKIMNLHLQKMASRTGPDVVAEFFSGLAEGLGDDFGSEVNELGRKFATLGPISFLLQPWMLAGASYEIYSQASDLAETAGALLADPEGAKELAKTFFQSVFTEGATVARDFGVAIGKDARSKVGALVNAGKSEGGGAESTAGNLAETARTATHFAFELGRILGPIVFEIVLDIVAPGAILLRTGGVAIRSVIRGLSAMPNLGIGQRLTHLGGKALRQLVKSRDFNVLGETHPHYLTLQLSGGRLVCAVCSDPPCKDLLMRIETVLKSDLDDDERKTLEGLQRRVMAHRDAWGGLKEDDAKKILDEFTEEFESSQDAAIIVTRDEELRDRTTPDPDTAPSVTFTWNQEDLIEHVNEHFGGLKKDILQALRERSTDESFLSALNEEVARLTPEEKDQLINNGQKIWVPDVTKPVSVDYHCKVLLARIRVYEDLAANLLSRPVDDVDIYGYRRSNGELVKYNHQTREFAVASETGQVQSYFKCDGLEYYRNDFEKRSGASKL